MDGFNTLPERKTWERIIDKSRFIGIAVPLTTVEQIDKAMQNIREEYPNARHYVYAYRLHDGFIEKSSDDGEPQGTGGRPILDILQHRNIWNVLLVVVRYFGGVLLGTGGLSRAYGGTARQLINETELKELALYQIYVLSVPYEWFEMLKYQFDQHNWIIEKEDFRDVIELLVHVHGQEAEVFQKWVDDFTRRQVRCEVQGTIWR
ncbi:IMPACT family protein [Desulfosporosinus shakirovi]|uniref:IMPACT family protein n=1 Tax=Desulfosporosinus shakirovi TaxID=2885154 RepID=UPI001E65D0BC|nr:YigZ family protein [Desulfosporosinus sp. SRJS8]MCB8816652.1 YigZ family protein [Desulfosporosinus sp. SRJS8]